MLNQKKIIALLGTVALGLTMTACGNAQTQDISLPNTASVASTVDQAAQVSKGNFSGRSDHVKTELIPVSRFF